MAVADAFMKMGGFHLGSPNTSSMPCLRSVTRPFQVLEPKLLLRRKPSSVLGGRMTLNGLGRGPVLISPHSAYSTDLPRELSMGLYHDLAEKKTWKNKPLTLALEFDLVSVRSHRPFRHRGLHQVKQVCQEFNPIANDKGTLPQGPSDLG